MTEPYIWAGPYRPDIRKFDPVHSRVLYPNKGVMAERRREKRQQAEARNALTPIYRTAKFRRQPREVQQRWLIDAGIFPENIEPTLVHYRYHIESDGTGNFEDVIVSVTTPEIVFVRIAR